jgi:hypothetical protein
MRIALISAAKRNQTIILGIFSISAVLIAGLTILFYLGCLKPAVSSPHENADLVTVIATQPEQYPLEKKVDAMTSGERRRLMYTVKTIHEPLGNPQ